MRASLTLSASALAVLIGMGGIVPAAAQGVGALPAADSRPGLSIPQVYEKLTAQGYWNIDKIERDPGSFEVRAHEKNGDRVKLYVDARTGEITHKRLEGQKRDRREDRGAGQRSGDGANCNERRCRDDLPPPPRPAAPAGGN